MILPYDTKNPIIFTSTGLSSLITLISISLFLFNEFLPKTSITDIFIFYSFTLKKAFFPLYSATSSSSSEILIN